LTVGGMPHVDAGTKLTLALPADRHDVDRVHPGRASRQTAKDAGAASQQRSAPSPSWRDARRRCAIPFVPCSSSCSGGPASALRWRGRLKWQRPRRADRADSRATGLHARLGRVIVKLPGVVHRPPVKR
jgi:hypothetical protein